MCKVGSMVMFGGQPWRVRSRARPKRDFIKSSNEYEPVKCPKLAE